MIKISERVRDNIAAIDMTTENGWRDMISLMHEVMSTDEIQYELAASPNIFSRWRAGETQPREVTRRLLQRSVLDLLDERLGVTDSQAKGKNTLVAIGYLGCRSVYINVSRDEAIRRYKQDREIDDEDFHFDIDEFIFHDEFEVYDVKPKQN